MILLQVLKECIIQKTIFFRRLLMKENSVIPTLFWYYKICIREVWLMSHAIEPNQENENIIIGKLIHENSYKREKKEIEFGNSKFDILKRENNNLIVVEVKKTSKYQEASIYQLYYYLLLLKRQEIEAIGEYRVPKENKIVYLELDNKIEKELLEIEKEIIILKYKEVPPKPKKKKYCWKCAYKEYCWS